MKEYFGAKKTEASDLQKLSSEVFNIETSMRIMKNVVVQFGTSQYSKNF